MQILTVVGSARRTKVKKKGGQTRDASRRLVFHFPSRAEFSLFLLLLLVEMGWTV